MTNAWINRICRDRQSTRVTASKLLQLSDDDSLSLWLNAILRDDDDDDDDYDR